MPTPKPPYPTKPGSSLVWSALTFERHGYLGPGGLTREFDHTYRYVIDSQGWLFHRLIGDEFGRTLGQAFRWQRSSHGDPAELSSRLIQKWTQRQTKFTVTPDLHSPTQGGISGRLAPAVLRFALMHRPRVLFSTCLFAIFTVMLLTAINPTGRNALATFASLLLVVLAAIALNRLAQLPSSRPWSKSSRPC